MIDCDGTDKPTDKYIGNANDRLNWPPNWGWKFSFVRKTLYLTIALIICCSGKDTLIEDEIKQAGHSFIVPYMVIMICNTFSRFVLH